MRKEVVVIFEWTKLPEEIKRVVADSLGFSNDCWVPVRSEFTPFGKETWADSLTFKGIEEYYKDQCVTNLYNSTFNEFIKDYGLEFEVWLLAQDIDLTSIKNILIEVCW